MARKATNSKIRMHFTSTSNRQLPPLVELLAKRRTTAQAGTHLRPFTPCSNLVLASSRASRRLRNDFTQEPTALARKNSNEWMF
jgi:hypothetical protein